ncbi:hypothetical protein ABZS78_38960, partial [Streptomyces decoyicus]
MARTTAWRRPVRPRSAAGTGTRRGTRPTRSTRASSPSEGPPGGPQHRRTVRGTVERGRPPGVLLPGMARQPFAMLTIGIVLLVESTTGSYGTAGAVSA